MLEFSMAVRELLREADPRLRCTILQFGPWGWCEYPPWEGEWVKLAVRADHLPDRVEVRFEADVVVAFYACDPQVVGSLADPDLVSKIIAAINTKASESTR